MLCEKVTKQVTCRHL